jgi:hypothetical protein
MTLPYLDKLRLFFVDKDPFLINNLFVTSNSILQARTTNLNIVKNYVGGIVGNIDTKPDSHYTYLVRFFRREDAEQLAPCLLYITFFLLQDKFKVKYLTLDGTAWELGGKYYHFLTLCVIYEGVSIPIWWKDLGHKGASSQSERADFLVDALKRYDLKGMILLADREYIGEEWFAFLRKKGIHFIIRLKKEIYRTYVDQQLTPVEAMSRRYDSSQKKRYSHLKRLANSPMYQNTGVAKHIQIDGEIYLFVMYKNPNPMADKEDVMLFFLSSLNKKEQVIKNYPRRWTIECCFKHLKSNGFNLETINIKGPAKENLMFTILVFLYTFSIVQGLKEYIKSNKIFKKYQSGKKSLAVSIFKKGNDRLVSTLNNSKIFYQILMQSIREKPPKWVYLKEKCTTIKHHVQ